MIARKTPPPYLVTSDICFVNRGRLSEDASIGVRADNLHVGALDLHLPGDARDGAAGAGARNEHVELA
jgi:hypothetical protein